MHRKVMTGPDFKHTYTMKNKLRCSGDPSGVFGTRYLEISPIEATTLSPSNPILPPQAKSRERSKAMQSQTFLYSFAPEQPVT